MSVTRKRRIVFLADGLGAGGAERQMCLLVENLPDSWERAVCSLHDGHFRKRLETRGFPVVFPQERLSGIKKLLWFKEAVKRCNPDLIHCWGSASMLMSHLLFRGKIPIVNGSVRRSYIPEGFTDKARLKISSRLGDVTVSNSHAAFNALGLTGKRYRVIPNGFSSERNIVHKNAEQPLSPGLTYVVMCANMKPGKDYLLLLEAASQLRAKADHPLFSYRFWFIGGVQDEDYVLQLKSLIQHLHMEPFVRITGRVDSPAAYLAEADIAVLLNDLRFHSEGLSNSIMEYMAAGLPVVCTDAGGNSELITPSTGILVPPHDATAVSEAIHLLSCRKSLARAMGEAGRKRIVDEFSLSRMVDRYCDLYHSFFLS